MPWNGSGIPQRVHNWQADRDAGIKIRADRHDQEDDNIVAMMANTLTLDGQNSPNQNISWGGQRITNLATGAAAGDAVNKAQMDAADAANSAEATAAGRTVTVTVNDTAPGPLEAKFSTGAGIIADIVDPGSNEKFSLTATWTSLDSKPVPMPQPEAEAGTATTERTITAAVLAAAIAAQAKTTRIHVRHTETQNTQGGTPAVDAWTKRKLNTTVSNTIAGASLSGDQVTLPAGDYRIVSASQAVYRTNQSFSRLRNVTANSDVIFGGNIYASAAQASPSEVYGHGQQSLLPSSEFTLAATTQVELQYYVKSGGGGSNGLGLPVNITGYSEVYAELIIEKVG